MYWPFYTGFLILSIKLDKLADQVLLDEALVL
jgi:hypothetical protein